MNGSWPMAIVAGTVSAYWFCVFVMVGRSWIKFRGPAGAVPKTPMERWLWLVWVPNTAAWVALPWLAWARPERWLAGEVWVPSGGRWLAALAAVLAFVLTTRCWLAMGSNWTMAVNPKKKTALITQGPFGVVRHPIYALSLLLMAATTLVVTAWAMWLVGAIHITMILAKAHSEERYLRTLHGSAYEAYCRETSRFLPLRPQWFRLRRQAPA